MKFLTFFSNIRKNKKWYIILRIFINFGILIKLFRLIDINWNLLKIMIITIYTNKDVNIYYKEYQN